MTIRSFLLELHHRNPVLSAAGWFHLVVLLAAMVGVAFDSRQILGISPWIKPAKFSISILAYVWTMAWILEALPNHARAVRRVSWGIAATMVIEIVCISLQSFRGVPSHFNISSPLNGAIFSVMGLSILANTLIVTLVLVFFFRKDPDTTQRDLRAAQCPCQQI